MQANKWRKLLNRARRPLSIRPRSPVLLLEELESRLTPSVTFITMPSSGIAGQPLSPAVQVSVKGQEGTFTFPFSGDPVTLAVVTGPGGFSPSAPPPTATTDSSGVATFNNLGLDAAGSSTFVASDAQTKGTSAPSSSVVINPAPASQLIVSASSSVVPEGTPVGFTVVATDAFGNPATGSTIHFSSSTT